MARKEHSMVDYYYGIITTPNEGGPSNIKIYKDLNIDDKPIIVFEGSLIDALKKFKIYIPKHLKEEHNKWGEAEVTCEPI